MSLSEIVIVGGYHDGTSGVAHPDVLAVGFLVMFSDDEEYCHGYHTTGERDEEGRLIFRPGSGLSVTDDDPV